MTTDELLHPAEDTAFFEGWVAGRDNGRVALLCAELSRLAYAPFAKIAEETGRIGLTDATPIGGLVADTHTAGGAAGANRGDGGARGERGDRGTGGAAASERAGQARAGTGAGAGTGTGAGTGSAAVPAKRGEGIEGFWVRDPRRGAVYVVFRGTESGSYDDLVTDLLTIPTRWPGPSQVHAGFAAGYRSVAAQMPWRRGVAAQEWVLTGHSLGGALATLAASERPGPAARLVTFGAPRVGDQAFVSLLAGCEIERYVNCCDLVPRVPPESFDEAPLTTLLTDLLALNAQGLTLPEQLGMQAARGGAGLLARGVAAVLRKSGLQAQFLHAGPELYLDHAGSLHRGPSAEWVKSDQVLARGNYRGVVHREMPALNLQAMFARFGTLITLSLTGEGSRLVEGLRELLGDLARSATLANVLLRDLADHAPVGYVNALRKL